MSIAEAVTIATRRLWRPAGALVAAVAVSRWFFGGFIVFSIYWLALGISFVAAPVFITEHLGIGAALSRCRFLTEGHRWQIFIAILLASIVSRAAGNTILGVVGVASMLRVSTATVSIWIVFGAVTAGFSRRLLRQATLDQGRRAYSQDLLLSTGVLDGERRKDRGSSAALVD